MTTKKRKGFKPCPFCGCKKSKLIQYDGDTWRSCCGCGASTVACVGVRLANQYWEQRPDQKQETTT